MLNEIWRVSCATTTCDVQSLQRQGKRKRPREIFEFAFTSVTCNFLNIIRTLNYRTILLLTWKVKVLKTARLKKCIHIYQTGFDYTGCARRLKSLCIYDKIRANLEGSKKNAPNSFIFFFLKWSLLIRVF